MASCTHCSFQRWAVGYPQQVGHWRIPAAKYIIAAFQIGETEILTSNICVQIPSSSICIAFRKPFGCVRSFFFFFLKINVNLTILPGLLMEEY